ncbi:MAG: hypothetical protein J6L76_04895 [Clostridia bacterium]|nr:hypothetical protein [Clostridia bacterium]
MKRKLSLLLVLALVASMFVSMLPAQASSTTDYLTVDKTVYAKSDKISVKVNALPENPTGDLYIVLYPYPYTIGSTTGGVWVDVFVGGQQKVNVGDTVEITQNASTRMGAFSVSLVYYTQTGTIEDNIIHVGPYLEPTKPIYAPGEDIIINFSNITDDLGDCWFGLLKGNEPNTNRSSKERYAIQNGVNQLGGTSGSFNMDTFPDKLITGDLPEGDYKLILFKLSNRAELSNVATFTVGQPPQKKVPKLSVAKTTFTEGEDIVVSFSDVSTDMGKGAWLAMYPENPTLGSTQSYAWAMLTASADGSLVHGESGSFTFPEDAEGGSVPAGTATITPGKYELMILAADYTQLGEKITITVKAPVPDPVVSVGKTTYTVGEAIEIKYENISEDLGKGVWLAVYKKGATLGSTQSHVWAMLTASSDGSLVHGASGTFTFPEDAEGGSVHAGSQTLDAGAYDVMILAADYTQIGQTVSFEIQAKNTTTGDTSMAVTCAVVMMAIGAMVILQRKKDAVR